MSERIKKDLYTRVSGLTGLEPATSTVTGWCSNQLNYGPRKFCPKCCELIVIYIDLSTVGLGLPGSRYFVPVPGCKPDGPSLMTMNRLNGLARAYRRAKLSNQKRVGIQPPLAAGNLLNDPAG